MTGDRVRRVKDLLDRVRQTAPEHRARVLAEAKHSSPDGEHIASEVQALLAELDVAGDFLQPPSGAPEALAQTIIAPDVLREGVGSRIGPYHLLEQIGEGGFGVVYLAEQEHPIRRRVALKIIKLGMDTRQVIARFEQERQALAIMDHPGIAKVLDAGATATGRPYFAMELVRGVPVTQFCDSQCLGVRDRLELFAQICEAVQHAHHRGVIHRDLKPSNILVTRGDGDRPIPKVIDFGIAKAMQARLTERTLFTESRQLLGTPEYMSPEQAGLDASAAANVDTRSDVYSLGVLLYELLTGVTPFDPSRLRDAAFDELCRVIREVDPPRPSTRLSTMATLNEVAARRHTEPSRLRESVRGELDWIVMRCLEKDRTRRYASAADLAKDIGRHLAHEPLEAAPPGASYRVRKFARRHWREVTVAAALLLTLLLGLIGTAVGALRAVQARNDARASEARALKASDTEAAQRIRADEAALRSSRLAYSLAIGLASTEIEQGAISHARAELGATPRDFRGWEWSHLAWACDPVSRVFDTPRDTEGLAISDDGARLFARARSGEVRVFDVASGRLENSFKTPPGRSWRFHMPRANHDGSLLLTCIADHEDGWTGEGTITLWDVATSGEIWSERTSTLIGASFADGRWRRTPDGALRLDIQGEQVLDRVNFTSETLHWVYGPIGGSRSVVLVTEGAGWNVVWDLDTQREITRFGVDSLAIVPAAPEGIVAVATDRIMRINARTGETSLLPLARNDYQQVRVGGRRAFGLQSTQGVVQAFAWPAAVPIFKVNIPKDTGAAFVVDPDGTTAYVIGEAGVTQARAFANGQPFRTEVVWRGGYSTAISPTARHSVLVGWGSVCLFDTQTGENVWSRYPSRDPLYTAAFNADGLRLAVAGRSPSITLLDVTTGDATGVLDIPDPAMVTALAWSRAGDRLLAGLIDGRIIEFDPRTPENPPVVWPEPAPSAVTSLAFSPDDSLVAVVARAGMKFKDIHEPTPGAEQMLRIREARAGHATVALFPVATGIRGAAFAPDGRSIAVSTDSAVVRIDPHTARVLARVESPQPGEAMAFTPDGSRLAVIGNDDRVRVFSADELTLVASIKCVTWSNRRSAAFCPDGRTLHIADPSTPVIAYESGPAERHRRRLGATLAKGAVDLAFVRSGFVAEHARAMIQADPELSDDLRAIALELVLARGDDPNHIHNAAQLRMPVTPYGPAWGPLVEQMLAAVRVLPNDAGLRVSLALTQLRAGKAPEAAATARVVIDGMGANNDERCVWAWTILSLARSAMHEQESAREAIDRASALRDALPNAATHSLVRLMAEAQHAASGTDDGDAE
ncbi:MAG: protein kinase [Phycisphaeraceae bacterium]|nr:protein kinase [Phycisphaeraceae bacterium]